MSTSKKSQRLFLASHYAKVADQLPGFLGGSTEGLSVCYIPTASLVEKVKFFVASSKKALVAAGINVIELDVASASAEQIRKTVTDADVIFVEGGNTFYLLQELRRSGADQLIRQQVKDGKPYVGISAGAMIASADVEFASLMDSVQKGPDLDGNYEALSLVDFAVVPHYTNSPFKKACEKILSVYGATLDLKPITNLQSVQVIGEEMRIVSSER